MKTILDWYVYTMNEHTGVLLLIFLVFLIVWIWGVWICLTIETGIDRLTWLVAIIAVPLFGLLFFWLHRGNKSDDASTDKDSRPGWRRNIK